MFIMYDEILTERQRAKLREGECVVWAGRPRPRCWGDGSIFFLFFGILWSTITGLGVWHQVIPLWREFAAKPAWSNFLPAFGLSAFLTPFVCVGIGTLFLPLWRYILSSNTLWVVTDRRLLRFHFSFLTLRLSSDELPSDDKDKLLASLHPDDFPFAQSALKRLGDAAEDGDEEGQAAESVEANRFDERTDGTPKRIELERLPDGGIRIKWSLFSWGFIPLAVFTSLWGGFSVGTIYIMPLVQGEPIQPQVALFGIPFLLGTIFLTFLTLNSLGGRRELVRDGDGLSVYRGIFSLGFRRRYAIPADAEFVVQETSMSVNHQRVFKLVMRGGSGIVTLLKSIWIDHLAFIASVLNSR